VSLAAWVLCIAYTSEGDLAQACTYGELAVQQASTPADSAWSEGNLAWAWCRAGEVHRGLSVLARNAAAKRSVRFVLGEILGALRLGEAHWLAGEYNNARQTLEALLEPAEQCGMQFLLASAHRFLGEVALALNPAQREAPLAAPHFECSIAILQQIGGRERARPRLRRLRPTPSAARGHQAGTHLSDACPGDLRASGDATRT
jgi:tetratricopeptide (TPR) repeat protein